MEFGIIAFITTSKDDGFVARRIQHIAENIGVDASKVTLFRQERDPERNTRRGCYNAHLEVWDKMAAENLENGLIFEDDVFFLKPISWPRIEAALPKINWEVFYLGHRPEIWEPRLLKNTGISGIVEVRTNDTHAYIIKLSLAKRMANRPWHDVSSDTTLRNFSIGTAFAEFPMRAIQTGKFLSPSFFNGLSERNSQYLRYATQNWANVFRVVFGLLFVIVAQPWFFATSTWASNKVEADKKG